MRDPELVFKAQLAASALERAWQRWRVMHGLVADPMPAISSYVGYSLEEPWGQPRVVFGLSASDAEQLAALLNRHDCIGPVHATISGKQAAEIAAGASRPLPVPPQAPSVIAEQSTAGETPTQGKTRRAAGQAGEPDGPVYRRLARAAREARQAAAPGSGQAPAAQAAEAASAAEAGQAAEVGQAADAAQTTQGSAGEAVSGRPEPGAAGDEQQVSGPGGTGEAASSGEAENVGGAAGADGTVGINGAAGVDAAASVDAAAVPSEPDQQAPAPQTAPAQQPAGEAVRGQEPDPRQHHVNGPPASVLPPHLVSAETQPERAVPEQGVAISSRGEAGSESAPEDAAAPAQAGVDPAGVDPAGVDPAGSAGPENRSARDDDGDNGYGGDDDDDGPDGGGPGVGARRADRVIAAAGGPRGRTPGGEPGANVVAPERPGGGIITATSGSGVHSVAEGSGSGADSGKADEPGADVHNANARAETRAASERAARARAAEVRPADAGGTAAAPAEAPAAVQAADGPGPLALAASAARAATEVRIRAAMRRTRPSASHGRYAGPVRRQAQAAMARPEVASGAHAVLFDDPLQPRDEDDDVASAWGGPDFAAEPVFAVEDEYTEEEDFAAETAADPDVVPLRPRHEDADDDGEDPAAEDRPEHSPSGFARRNRITRGYAIPRLSRSKRPGAIPGL